jgi:hypothetical protein
MSHGLDPQLIRAAGKLSDLRMVMDSPDVTLDRLHDWACDHLDSVTRAIRVKLGARGAWTRTIDRRTRAALLALADVARQRADADRAAAESWRGQIDDDIVDEWRDQGLAEAHVCEASELVAAARNSSDAPVATMVLLNLLIRLISVVRATDRFSSGGAHVRLRRLPHLALSPRLLARPRVRRVLTAAA